MALSFMYGQRSTTELDAAKAIAQNAGVEHRVINIDLGNLGVLHSPIIILMCQIMTRRYSITYVPARNTIFLSYALAAAEVFGAEAIVIGQCGRLFRLSRLPTRIY
jgi:7-cyano-7-deazaguanine synthase